MSWYCKVKYNISFIMNKMIISGWFSVFINNMKFKHREFKLFIQDDSNLVAYPEL